MGRLGKSGGTGPWPNVAGAKHSVAAADIKAVRRVTDDTCGIGSSLSWPDDLTRWLMMTSWMIKQRDESVHSQR